MSSPCLFDSITGVFAFSVSSNLIFNLGHQALPFHPPSQLQDYVLAQVPVYPRVSK